MTNLDSSSRRNLEAHPLDEIGIEVNSLLACDADVAERFDGRSTIRNIRHGALSFFFSRIELPDRKLFSVGVDLVRGDELVAQQDYQWEILDPASSSLSQKDLRSLRSILNIVGKKGFTNGQA